VGDLPKAIINEAKSWFRPIGSLCTVAAFVGLGYGVTQFGCRNTAKSYGELFYPECVAVDTPIMGDGDIAVCRRGNASFKCTYSRLDGMGCTQVH
jgi:hypothetical protein